MDRKLPEQFSTSGKHLVHLPPMTELKPGCHLGKCMHKCMSIYTLAKQLEKFPNFMQA
jgi:hypothetical protein